MCTQCVHEVSGEYSPVAHPCQEGLDQSTQRRQLCEARRICWGVLLGSTSVSRRPRLPYEVAGEYSLAALLGSTPMAGALLGSTSMAGEYSSASYSDAISLQTMFC